MGVSAANGNLLGAYLKNRSVKLDPAAFGFSGTRTRTPGLRREEVAQRAKNNEATLLGPRTFGKDHHHRNQGRYLIVDTEQGKPKVVDHWTISDSIPVDYLVSK
jgi:hypothetical protein